MAITKPLTIVAAQIARLQPGDILQIPRLNIGGAGAGLPIVANQITITRSWHQIIGVGTNSQRQVRTIHGGVEGDLLLLQMAPGSSSITIDDGTGNIRAAGDFSLNTTFDKIGLICDGVLWHELFRSNN